MGRYFPCHVNQGVRNQNPYVPHTVLGAQDGRVEKTVSILALLTVDSNGRRQEIN